MLRLHFHQVIQSWACSLNWGGVHSEWLQPVSPSTHIAVHGGEGEYNTSRPTQLPGNKSGELTSLTDLQWNINTDPLQSTIQSTINSQCPICGIKIFLPIWQGDTNNPSEIIKLIISDNPGWVSSLWRCFSHPHGLKHSSKRRDPLACRWLAPLSFINSDICVSWGSAQGNSCFCKELLDERKYILHCNIIKLWKDDLLTVEKWKGKEVQLIHTILLWRYMSVRVQQPLQGCSGFWGMRGHASVVSRWANVTSWLVHLKGPPETSVCMSKCTFSVFQYFPHSVNRYSCYVYIHHTYGGLGGVAYVWEDTLGLLQPNSGEDELPFPCSSTAAIL